MENLNLVELKQEELVELQGGWWEAIVAALVLDTIVNYQACAAALEAGWSDGYAGGY